MKKLLSLFVTLLACFTAHALELPDIIGSNMMLQQNTEAKLWGWAQPNSVVEVTVSWHKKKYYGTANSEGRWDISVSTPAASYTPQTLTIKGDGEKKVLDNVLIGEVWFCSGQSNMEMPLRGFWNCPIEGANEAIAQSGKYKKSIRVATIDHIDAEVPQKKVTGGWKVCVPENASEFSACGYFFARTLTDILDVPVGIINCSWGGSCVEGWLPKEILLTYPDGLVPMDDTSYHRKMVMFNGMLSPLAGYTIKDDDASHVRFEIPEVRSTRKVDEILEDAYTEVMSGFLSADWRQLDLELRSAIIAAEEAGDESTIRRAKRLYSVFRTRVQHWYVRQCLEFNELGRDESGSTQNEKTKANRRTAIRRETAERLPVQSDLRQRRVAKDDWRVL